MARNKPGNANRIGNLLRRQAMVNFEPKPMECDAEIEVEGKDGVKEKAVCGGKLFDMKTFYNVYYIPATASPNGKSSCGKHPFEHFMCLSCGKVYAPKEWNKRAEETFSAASKKIIAPEDLKPEDNGSEE